MEKPAFNKLPGYLRYLRPKESGRRMRNADDRRKFADREDDEDHGMMDEEGEADQYGDEGGEEDMMDEFGEDELFEDENGEDEMLSVDLKSDENEDLGECSEKSIQEEGGEREDPDPSQAPAQES
mmetsp:Transcript_39659/g.60746  ORF Transcript_39659/g.60746 Transcript_39659/m.60746 type:complete len:125 (-) Transcript_39659:769-1143(-)